MKVRVALLVVLAAAGIAHADRKWTGWKLVPAPVNRPAAISSHIIYLHRCGLGGCIVHFGTTDDSRTDTSSIADPGDHTLSPFSQPDQVWQAVVQCVKDTYAAFDVTVTDVDPGTTVPHFEEMVGGVPNQLLAGFNNAGGIAPFDCAEIPNGISFTFDVYGPDAEQLCWTVAQETAHTFGLEHEYSAKDPMTYVQGYLPKRFQWEDAPCGTNAPGACQCAHGSQNSYKDIYTLFGVGAATPPSLAIKSPTDGKKVTPMFQVYLDATDDAAIDHTELWIDGAMVATAMQAPFTLQAPALDLGPHTLEVHAIDTTQMSSTQAIAITQGPPCTIDSGCDGTDVCVAGSCIPGPGVGGGLGAVCQANQECLSGECAQGGESLMHCVAPCDPGAANTCPHDFECLQAGTGGVCWPSGGCCSIGGDPRASGILAAAVLGVVLRRRKRR